MAYAVFLGSSSLSIFFTAASAELFILLVMGLIKSQFIRILLSVFFGGVKQQ